MSLCWKERQRSVIIDSFQKKKRARGDISEQVFEGWEGAQGSQSQKVALETDWRETLLRRMRSNDCSEGLDGFAKDVAALEVSVAGETKFRQDEHSNWDAVCQHHLY